MRRFLTKRSVAAMAIGTAALTVGGLRLTEDDGSAAAATDGALARVLDVEVELVEQQPGHDIQIRHTGTIRARRDAVLGVEVGGRVTAVMVDVGDRVAAGEPLLRIDSSVPEARRAELRARRAAVAAELAEAEAGPRREVIDAARAALRRAEEDLRLAELQVGRTRDLVRREVAAQDELDVATTRVATLDAALAEARARLAELENGTRVEVIAAARARLEELDAGIARLEVEIGDATLAAPFAGAIAERHVDEGAVLDVGAPALRLVETGRLEGWFGLPAEVADRIVDCVENTTLSIAERKLATTGARVLPTLDRVTRTTTVVFDLEPDAVARSGDVVRLTWTRTVPTPGFWLPVEALSPTSRGMWSCYVVAPAEDGERIARADLEVLHVAGDRAFARGTLIDGDRVVARGVQRVVPGQLVRAVPPSERQGEAR